MNKQKRASANQHGFTNEMLDSFYSPEDILNGNLSGMQTKLDLLKKSIIERMLKGEMNHHLGYANGEVPPEEVSNRRNGHSTKTLITENGKAQISIPRDRDSSFNPIVVPKHMRRMEGFDEKVIALYARGLSTRDIQHYIREIYQVDVSSELISDITEEVLEEVAIWQNRTLETVYTIVYLDCIRVKIRDSAHIINKAIYVAIGVDLEGNKEILGLWVSQNEGSKFWLSVLTEIKNRGVKDILIACCDGLTGFPEAIEAVFPQTTVQLCIVHMIRNSLKFVPDKDYKGVTGGLKMIYTAPTAAAAKKALSDFAETWGKKYPSIPTLWERHWDNIIPFLAYPHAIRRVIYTTNMIEAVNRQIRKVIKTKGSFPTDDAALKLIYLALKNAKLSKIMPDREWKAALTQFAIIFKDRLDQ
jgi:transposase-like protein